jgi:hypothetical protein
LATTSPRAPLGSLERPTGALRPGRCPLPQPFHPALPPPPQTLTWVWPETTPGSAEPSLPSRGVSQRPQTGPWLMGGGCGAEQESRSSWFGREARPGWGWGSAGERYQLLRMNYLPASGLHAALGCLPVHIHAATPVLQQVGERGTLDLQLGDRYYQNNMMSTEQQLWGCANPISANGSKGISTCLSFSTPDMVGTEIFKCLLI